MTPSASDIEDARTLAGRFSAFVGTLSTAEADAFQDAIDHAFEVIPDAFPTTGADLTS